MTQILLYTLLAVLYAFFAIVVIFTESDKTAIGVLRVLTLPLVLPFITIITFIGAAWLAYSYVMEGRKVFK